MRIVLAVAVEREHEAAAGGGESRTQRGGFAAVARQINDPQVRITDGEQSEPIERGVGAAVVDEQYLVRTTDRGGDVGEFLVQPLDVPLFVVDGNDEGDGGNVKHAHAKKLSTPSITCSTSSLVRSGCMGSERISRATRSTTGSSAASPHTARQAGWRWMGVG